MNVISLSNVKKTYSLGDAKINALDGVTISIKKGEFVSILGPSGSGKSTMLNMIGLLDTPTSGKIVLEKTDTSELDEKRRSEIRNRQIGFVFQFFFLSPFLNALENVQMPCMFMGVPKSQREKKAEELLKKLGLGKRMHSMPSQLSGGERQRVAIARALSTSPSIILADEPTGNLDSKTGAEILNILKDLWEQGNTVIVVTHDEKLAEKARRTVHLFDGKITKDVTRK